MQQKRPSPFPRRVVFMYPMAESVLANAASPEEIVATDERVRANLARLLQARLVHESTLGVWVHPVLIAVIVFIAWSGAPHNLLVAWAGFVVLSTALRGAWLVMASRGSVADRTVRTGVRVTVTLLALVWGVGGALVLPIVPFETGALILVVLAGIIASALTTLAADPLSLRGFLAAIALPVLVSLALSERRYDYAADARGARIRGADPRYRADERAAPRARARALVVRGAADDPERHPRLLEDRGRAPRARVDSVRRGEARPCDGEPAGRARAREASRASRGRDAGSAARRARRSHAAAASPHESDRQRHQVHRAGRNRRFGHDGAGGGRSCRAAVRGPRHRHRDRAGTSRPRVQGIHASGRDHDAARRRHGTGPRDFAAARPPDGRRALRAERSGPRQHIRVHARPRGRARAAAAGAAP